MYRRWKGLGIKSLNFVLFKRKQWCSVQNSYLFNSYFRLLGLFQKESILPSAIFDNVSCDTFIILAEELKCRLPFVFVHVAILTSVREKSMN